MIAPPEPVSQIIQPKLRLPKVGKRMTIAIGLSCFRGVLIAADTLVCCEDGTATEETKVTSFAGKSGIFAIANASSDLNATKTMVNSIVDRLTKKTIPDIGTLQAEFSDEMLTWYGKLSTSQTSQFIFAAKLNGDVPRLYFCEPPSTFLQDTNGYVGAGCGVSITNPIVRTLFGFSDIDDVQVSLRKAAYLISRAKRENIYCGKRTNCTVIGINSLEPITVNILDFKSAEQHATQLDFILQSTATLYLGSTDDNIQQNSKGIAEMMEHQKTMRIIKFHNTYGAEIKL